jgi:hypothetical protein
MILRGPWSVSGVPLACAYPFFSAFARSFASRYRAANVTIGLRAALECHPVVGYILGDD